MKTQIISAVVGVTFCLAGFLMEKTWPSAIRCIDGIFIGLLAYLITLITLWDKKIAKLDLLPPATARLQRMMIHFGLSDSISNKHENAADSYWNLCVIKASTGIYTQKTPHLINIPNEERRLFWQQAILNTQLNWQCTTNVII